MNVQKYFSMNPAFPHPDDENEGDALPMADAVAWAVRVLRDPNAGSFERGRAAAELLIAFEALEVPNA
jgi:hypothetical protein